VLSRESRSQFRTNSLTYQVAEEISKIILDGGLRPGERLPSMAELEVRFGVSHTVMREALRVLEARGLVQVQHGKRVLVALAPSEAITTSLSAILRLHDGTLLHLMEFRTILENEVASLAAARRTDKDLHKLKACLAEMEHSLDSPQGYVDADVAFHNALVDATHNPVLIGVTNSLHELLVESREVSFRGPPVGGSRALKAHQRIYQMVKAQDKQAARDAMHQHLRETQEDMEIAIAEGRLGNKLGHQSL
jgi:GntR family transcriptional activator of glc operon